MSDIELLALHGSAVKKAGSPAAVAAVLGADEAEIETALEAAVAAGRAAGAKGTFMVAPAGREWLDAQLPGGLRRVPRRPRRDRGLRALRADQPRAAGALHRLADDARGRRRARPQRPLRRRLRRRHDRPPRRPARARREGARPLRRARPPARHLRGRASTRPTTRSSPASIDWVCGARIDSYHTVWFELHEDLLRMLGREREEAP